MGTVSMFVYVAISLHLSHLPSLLSLLSGGNTKFLVKRKAFFSFPRMKKARCPIATVFVSYAVEYVFFVIVIFFEIIGSKWAADVIVVFTWAICHRTLNKEIWKIYSINMDVSVSSTSNTVGVLRSLFSSSKIRGNSFRYGFGKRIQLNARKLAVEGKGRVPVWH